MPEVAGSKIEETVLRYLEEHYTMTIATAKGETPWAASVFYANDWFTLYFLSDPASRHSENIADNPAVAVTINEDYHDWRKIKGVQMEGKAELVAAEDQVAKAVAAYVNKYSFTAAYLKVMSSPFPRVAGYLDKLLAQLPFMPSLPTTFTASFYKVIPTKVRFIDNEKSFSHHEEFLL
jgi:uncharacterized protein YhbP (UPF0306 family)